MEEFIEKIYFCSRLNDQEKIKFIVDICNVFSGMSMNIDEKYYLRYAKNVNNSGMGAFQLWERFYDGSGNKNTGLGYDEIIDMYIDSINRHVKRK